MTCSDVKIIDANYTGEQLSCSSLGVYGKSTLYSREDILQRVMILILNEGCSYRGEQEGSPALLAFIEGGNTPPDVALISLLVDVCNRVQVKLDQDTKALVENIYGTVNSGKITINISMRDGTTISGELANAGV